MTFEKLLEKLEKRPDMICLPGVRLIMNGREEKVGQKEHDNGIYGFYGFYEENGIWHLYFAVEKLWILKSGTEEEIILSYYRMVVNMSYVAKMQSLIEKRNDPSANIRFIGSPIPDCWDMSASEFRLNYRRI